MRPSISSPPQTLIPALVGISLCVLVGAEARAQEPVSAGPSDTIILTAPVHGFYMHFGPGALLFNAGAKVKAAGAVIPGGTVKIDPNETLITEFGYRWGNVGVSLTSGYPPQATVNGAGSLSSLGTLGRIRYGPTVLTAHYHFTQLGRFQPYVGAGPVFLLIFKNEDGAIRHLNVRDHIGAAVQLGAEYVVTPRWSLFFDAKKAMLKTTATAYLGSALINADIRLDPTVITGGLSYRF